MAKHHRPFNPKALRRYAGPAIQPQLGPDTLVYRYTILVPVEEIKAGAATRPIATADDLQNLQLMLIRHFGGVTLSVAIPSLIGAGARDPRRPRKTLELNKHAHFTVYAAAVSASDAYFRAFQGELADALNEGIILVERQEVTIL
jgi:hypothetical protein